MRTSGSAWAVVTGAARGIGRAIAVRLAASGASVAVVDAAHGVDAIGLRCDVTDPAAVDAVIGAVLSAWGGVDVLVCNAGGGTGPIHGNRASEVDLGELEAALRLNLCGTTHCCRAVAGPMRAQGRGSIVTMSSINGLASTADGATRTTAWPRRRWRSTPGTWRATCARTASVSTP
ncbi:3-oxoacyl-[acyl-carrier protein] reductase [Lentzea xinjiangensis]|uniref:3-oxoacyl-[acyl-carrier protein] reductase n=1 Tax=Lentzea xinjiangensis TaxID=402600 RepID=A0A1H9W951_9PSEU|nr:3-oxoacyl-[acyl-carrier protein] reductase [Lentzea xinjiangensis]